MKIRILRRVLLSLLVLLALYLGAGAVLPFVHQPGVSEGTEQAFETASFYSDQPSGERASVISDNGEALEERIRLISQAKERIILSTFEFDADESGKDMLAALLAAAKRGVKVQVLADGAASILQMDRNPYFYALSREPNAEIRIYNPIHIWKPWTTMGRMHDKYVIADHTAYILGGRNTYDYFLGDGPGYKNYDWDLLVWGQEEEKIPSLALLEEYFQGVWNLPVCRAFGEGSLFTGKGKIDQAEQELESRYEKLQTDRKDWFEEKDYKKTTVPVNRISLLTNPTTIWAKEPVVFYQMTELMKSARKEVVFHTPYIICNDWMLERLSGICREVKTVRMMTNSVANNGNPFGAMDYEKQKGKILKTGVQILEYDGGVSYHGKCFTMDDRISGIGSFNWDMRSAYLDTELMLIVDSKKLNRELRERMEEYEAKALVVTDLENFQIPEGMQAQKTDAKKEFQRKVLRFFGGWARFLM